ncbi:hypothetical protein LINPERPRIM_LOCUS4012, partial [Linum perenne]
MDISFTSLQQTSFEQISTSQCLVHQLERFLHKLLIKGSRSVDFEHSVHPIWPCALKIQFLELF